MKPELLPPSLRKNDALARTLIMAVSVIVFVTVLFLSRYTVKSTLPFDVHWFAFSNAMLNTGVAVLLLAALATVKRKSYLLHKKLMVAAIILSVLFLLSYIAHHLFSGETRYGDVNHDGLVDEVEKAAVGNSRMFYYFILLTHIPLAGIILPMILFTAYRALTGEYTRHKKLARITWPVWFYVAVTGVIVYWMIRPYYE